MSNGASMGGMVKPVLVRVKPGAGPGRPPRYLGPGA
jgi:hypothetical protein